MDDLEEALRNIDIFCRVLVKKMTTEENEENENVAVEPMEKLLYRKNVIGVKPEETRPSKPFISLPHLEEPLIDVVEEVSQIKILLQERCRDKVVTVHTAVNGIQICRRECHTSLEGKEICVEKCHELDLPVHHLNIDSMRSRCNNNTVFEVDIPKRSF